MNMKYETWSRAILLTVCVLLIGVNAFLIFQNNQLKGALTNSRAPVIETGYRFSKLEVSNLNGAKETLDLADGEANTLLLVFNSACMYCEQQYDSWRETAQNLPANWRVVAVSSETDLEKLKEHVRAENLSGIRVATMDGNEMKRARITFTPITAALDPRGEVVKVWPGLWKKGFDLQ